MYVYITVHNCCTQHSTEQFWYLPSYSPDRHHCSDAVYWRGEITEKQWLKIAMKSNNSKRKDKLE